MRSAICLSGLARTYRQVHPVFMRNLVAPLAARGTVDIFISTWDTVDLNALASKTVVEQLVDLNELMQLYRPCVLEVERFACVRSAFVLSNYTTCQCPIPQIVRNGILLAMPAQYKVFKCNQLKIDQERLMRESYDLVVRTRFDLEIAPLRVEELDLTKINCLYDHSGLIGDYFYIANSKMMDVLCDVFINYHHLLNIEGTDMGPERNLKNHALQYGLETKVLTNHNYALVRDSHRIQFRWDGVDYRPTVI